MQNEWTAESPDHATQLQAALLITNHADHLPNLARLRASTMNERAEEEHIPTSRSSKRAHAWIGKR